jgi:hypothetical protein
MPDPGSHAYDVQRTRLRAQYDDDGTRHRPDGKADEAADAELERENPPVTLGDPERAAGPRSERHAGGEPAAGVPLRSTAFVDHDLIPAEVLESGPPVQWEDAPEGAAELALVCTDRDAGDAVHWVVVGLPPTAGELRADGGLPDGAAAGRADDGTMGWSAPHPPVGESHRLFFRLLALDSPLGLGEGVTAAELHAAAEGHVLARGTLIGIAAR